MRFIQILLIAMLVWAPVMATSVAHAERAGRAVAAEKSKKGKKAKAGKAKKGKKEAKAKGKKTGKKAAAKGKAKGKGKKAKKVASAKKPKSHAPAEHLDTAADPAENFEVSPEMQDDLPAPNNGDLTD